ncbi:L-aspartate oxidase [Roseovarius sp. CAU 1744]|uniref:L-aspartate oxidase n=1 Tax=Roseovarius sp. CAU 1744 TaxID=3140368 RepID=UPI00325B3ADE
MTGLEELKGRRAIIGSGIAGLVTALELAPHPVAIITCAAPGKESSSIWAQGGIAAALGPDDSVDLHLADTLAAGAGLCDAPVAKELLAEAEQTIAALERFGVTFDRDAAGQYVFGLEAAHARRRILHAAKDGTGAKIIRALLNAAQNCSSIAFLTGVEARRLRVRNGAVSGVLLQQGSRFETLPTSRVVMATGGLGSLFDATTNPPGNFGQGVMMAARAGAELADMEFVQFHPTALDAPRTPLGLISEAVRGEGAILVDEQGRRFMADIPRAELAPRDVVARAIHAERAENRRVFLDARPALGDRFADRFPEIDKLCRSAGIDPARQPIPVRPAAHYYMGGIATDKTGRSSLAGLWAVGECAATGLRGANRLASNSLLEATVMARRAARDLAEHPIPPLADPADNPRPVASPDLTRVRPTVSNTLGVVRDGAGLTQAIQNLLPIAEGDGPGADPAIVALCIAVFAHLRKETRGGHMRTDYPGLSAEPSSRRLCLDDVLKLARTHDVQPLLQSA